MYLKDYQRGWFTRINSKKVTTLGIYKHKKSTVNGLILVVNNQQLKQFDQRELSVGHTRELVDPKSIKPYVQGINIDGKVFTYSTSHRKTANQEYPLIQSYLDMVLLGCFKIGEKFALDFVKHTVDWGFPWLNDRSDPIYPRYYRHKKTKHIDSFLQKNVPVVIQNRI